MTATNQRLNRASELEFDFDAPISRATTDSAKWSYFDEDVLPLWVADMDFVSPQPILTALADRVRHGVFGYASEPASLKEAICDRLLRKQQWKVEPESLVFLPGLVCGLNAVVRAVGNAGDGVMVSTPVYPPFLSAPDNQRRVLHDAPLAKSEQSTSNCGQIYYQPDLDRMEEAVQPSTSLFLLCNPHNPVGRSFTRGELEELGAFCEAHDMVICSDEIHCDLAMGDTAHVSIASLAPELESRTITLLAPSKTFNIPGLGCSVAVIPNDELRDQFQTSIRGIVPHVNVLGLVAAEAAYRQCDTWLEALLDYLTNNRNFVVEYLTENLPEVKFTVPEATYLSWIDCQNLDVHGYDSPCEFFLKEARVALNDGERFGDNGKGFVRLNYGCSRQVLEQALTRMVTAVRAHT